MREKKVTKVVVAEFIYNKQDKQGKNNDTKTKSCCRCINNRSESVCFMLVGGKKGEKEN